MKKILFINGTVRENSRTLELARAVIDQLEGDIEEVDLIKEEPMHHTPEKLKLRDELIEKAKHIYFDAYDHIGLRDYVKDMTYMLNYFSKNYNKKKLNEYKPLDLSDIEKRIAEKSAALK